MINNHRGGQRGEEVVQIRQIGGFEIHHDMPAQRGDAFGDFGQNLTRREIRKAPDEIEARTAHTSLVHGLQLCITDIARNGRSEEHTCELQSLMRISYAVFCLKKKTTYNKEPTTS